jgi:hypothetical protein
MEEDLRGDGDFSKLMKTKIDDLSVETLTLTVFFRLHMYRASTCIERAHVYELDT